MVSRRYSCVLVCQLIGRQCSCGYGVGFGRGGAWCGVVCPSVALVMMVSVDILRYMR